MKILGFLLFVAGMLIIAHQTSWIVVIGLFLVLFGYEINNLIIWAERINDLLLELQGDKQ